MTRTESSRERTTTTPSSFTDAVRAVTDELRLEPLSPPLLNQIASRVDQLGRRVHGLGWARDHEIGACLTAAVSELSRAREQPEANRSEMVQRALQQLREALAHAEEGLRPPSASLAAAAPAGEVAHGE